MPKSQQQVVLVLSLEIVIHCPECSMSEVSKVRKRNVYTPEYCCFKTKPKKKNEFSRLK